jgi:uncharacterized protein
MMLAIFIVGLTGSLHCVGMCGPIALLINGTNKRQYLFNRLAYHAGRTTTYMLLGLIMGLMGKIFQFGGLQSFLSLAGGAMIIALLVVPAFKRTIPFFSSAFIQLKTLLGKHLLSKSIYSKFLTGLLNGFLPCGLVYSALILALVQPSLQRSVLAMALFGLSTVPALIAFTISANSLQKLLPVSVSTLQKVALVAVAVIMIWRGMAFALPEVIPGSAIICHS